MRAETKEYTIAEPIGQTQSGQPGGGQGDYRVILYNDDWHGFDEVVVQLQKATGYGLEKAARIVYEVDNKGRAACYWGSREDCHRVAGILREIRLQVEVDCD